MFLNIEPFINIPTCDLMMCQDEVTNVGTININWNTDDEPQELMVFIEQGADDE